MKIIRYLFFAFLIILLLKPAGGHTAERQPLIIRVCMIDGADKINIVVKGAYKIYAIDSDRILMEGPRLRANITGTKSGLLIGRKEIKVYGVRIKPYKDSNIFIEGRRFRGEAVIVRKDDTKLLMINNIDLEDYLYGVLYHEVSHRWPLEALKAQAIAARTFAVYQKRQNKQQPYDLRSDIYSQVYGGRTSEKWATTRAVNLTKDKVLVFTSEIFPSYYHATCAGHTEDASNLWNMDIAPLKGVECNFCKGSPHYKWAREIPLWKIEGKLMDSGYKIGKLSSINISSRNKSGRAQILEVRDGAGVSLILTAKDFRQMLGPNEVKSTNFDASIKWGHLVLKGLGWGHGAGMCQWGAYGMARENKRAEEILKHYYPGAEITTIDKI